MRNRKLLVVAVLLIGTLGVITVMPAGAQTGSSSFWQFSAKFLCGEMFRDFANNTGTPGREEAPVVDGRYRTAINFHNASLSRSISRLTIAKKALVLFPTDPEDAAPETAQTPETFRRPPTSVPPDGGFEIDCADIREVLLNEDPNVSNDQPDPRREAPFIKGYVVILVSSYLAPDVVAAYTGHGFAETGTTTADPERNTRCEREVGEDCTLVEGHSEQIVNIPARRITNND